MAVYFSGTSTKQTYEVGRSYINSRGQAVTANKDGSFGNRQTGQVMRGSSYNPTVAWYADGADANMWGAYHNGPVQSAQSSQSSFRTDAGKEVFTRPAVAAPSGANGSDVQRVAPVAAAAVAPVSAIRIAAPVVSLGNRGAFLRDNSWSGKDDPPQDMLWGGIHYMASPRFTNMELLEARLGDSELISAVLGLATLGADIGHTARVYADRAGFDNGKGITRAVERAAQPQNVGDAMRSGYNALQDWANENKAREAQEREWLEDANDVIDFKLHLNGIEGQKAGDFSALPNIW